MRRSQWVPCVSTLAGGVLMLALGACGDSTSSNTPADLPPAEVSDIGSAEADEVDQAAGALTTPVTEGLVTSGSGCPTADTETDTDGDHTPDQTVYTFALPACSFTGVRGGTLEITGTVTLTDPTPNAFDLAATATLADLTFRLTTPDASRSYQAVRNGTRTLTGNAQGASLSNAVTVVRSFSGSGDATIVHNLLLEFTPAAGGQLAFGEPLPSGTFVRSGTFTWSRGLVSRTFTVTTVAPLVWDASCTTDRKIASGETHATLGDGSYVRTVWTGCGADPTRSFVPAS